MTLSKSSSTLNAPMPRDVLSGERDRNRQRGGLVTRLARRGVLEKLRGLKHGHLQIHDHGEVFSFGRRSDDFPQPITVHVIDPAFYPDLAFGGSIGAGEAYMLGHWHCDNLVDLIRLMLRNRPVLAMIDGGMGRLRAPVNRLFHWLHRNSVSGSRRNIEAHYDLGNEFFKLFLDDTLMYSAGVFETPQSTLEEASTAKLDRICRKLELGPDDHVVEIGTGWGGFAVHAAGRYGCRVTTTTISPAQYELARERVRKAGLEDRIELLLKDFRHLDGQYDKLVSIEMIEAIGEDNIGPFFGVCNRLLKPDGKMLVQAITIADSLYERYRKSVDFMQRYIFPGGFLPSVGSLCQGIARHSDMRLFHLEDIGPHYARTLSHWRRRLHENLQAVRSLGYGDQFLRMWEFYFCYCEGGFLERSVGDVQMVLVRAGDRSEPLLSA